MKEKNNLFSFAQASNDFKVEVHISKVSTIDISVDACTSCAM